MRTEVVMLFPAVLLFADVLGAGETFGVFSFFVLVILIASLLFVREKLVVPMFVAGLGVAVFLFRYFEFINQAERIGAWLFIFLIIEFVYLVATLVKDKRGSL